MRVLGLSSCGTEEWKHGPERQGIAEEDSLLKQRDAALKQEGVPDWNAH